MGIGREVADAYIEVHGDLSKFRDDLNDANGTMADWAEEQADSFTEAWGKRMTVRMDKQWGSIVDALHSGEKVDFSRMIKNFDLNDIDEASRKITEMLGTMRDAGKLTDDQLADTSDSITKQIGILKQQQQLEQNLAADRALWGRAHEAMMKQAAQARKDAAEGERNMLREAFAENARYDAARKKMFDEAMAMNRAHDAAVKFRANAFKQMMKDMADAESKMLTEAFAENKRYDASLRAMRKAQAEDQKRMLADAYTENARFDAARRTMVEAAIRDNEAWARTFAGVAAAAKKADLEGKFRAIGQAMATGDWSRIAQGAKNMEELRDRTMDTAREMRSLGRMTNEEFMEVQARLALVSNDVGAYNIRFDEANKKSAQHARDWSVIQRMVANAGKKFAGFAGLNVLTDVFREGAAFFQDLDRNAVKIGKMSLAVGSLGSILVSSFGGLAVIGQDLAKMAQIGILAPGFMVAAGIQIAVLSAALKDMGTVLEDLGPRFNALQDTISSNFWAEAEQPIRNLVDGLLPALSVKLGETATAWGAFFGEIANVAATINLDDMATMFDRMNSAIGISQGAIRPLMEAFTILGMVASQYFERFATWIVDLSVKFDDFITGAAADGRLIVWIEEAIQAFKDVWSILGSAIGIFNAVGDAAEAAGIGGLSTLAASLAGVSEVMNSSGFQSTLTLLFIGAAQAARDIGTALLELGPSISAFMPTLAVALATIGETVATVIGYIGQIMENPVFQQGLVDFIRGIQAGVEALAPAIGPMGDSLGQIGSLLGQVASQVGTIVAALVTNLSPVLDLVTAAFGRITFAAGPEIVSIIETLSSILQPLIAAVLPPLESLIMTMLPVLSGALAALQPVFGALITVITPIIEGIAALVAMIAPYLVPAFEKISAALAPVIEVFGQVVAVIMSVLVPVLGFLLIGIINNLIGVFEGLSNFIMGFVTIVTAIFTGFGEFFTKLFQGDIGGALGALGTMFSTIWDGIVQMLSGALEFIWNAVQLLFIGKLVVGIKGALTGISAFFKSSWDDIVKWVSGGMQGMNAVVTSVFTTVRGFITNVLSAIGAFFRSTWDNIVNAVRGAVTGIQNTVTSVMNSVRGFISSVLSGIQGIFSSIWNTIVNVVRGGLTNIYSNVSSILSSVRSFIGNAFNAAVGLVRSAWSSMVGAVSSGVSNVMGWVSSLPGRIGGALSGLGGLLVGAGQAIINGLLAGLKASWGAVTSFVGGIASWIRDNKGPLPYDRRLLIPAGNAIMQGLGKGLEDKLPMLKSVLQTVTDTMTDTVTASFATSKMYLAGADAALGLADGLKSNKSKVADALSAVMPAASTSLSASLVAGSGAGMPGVGAPTPQPSGPSIVVADGAIRVLTPTKNPELVAEKVIDEFAAFSNL